MKRMLINATQPEELRVAMVDGQFLYDLDIEVASHSQKKASIYKGKITRVEPSLEAAFVDYGASRHGFLPFKEVAREYYAQAEKSNGKTAIKDALKEGQEVLVQVEKEERGSKGAALTTFPSLAGRYLVLMPNNPRAGGISRRVEGDDRSELRENLSELDVPPGMGLIVRTAGVGQSVEELQWDLDYLLRLWEAIETAAADKPGPFLVFQESNVIIRAIRDYFRQDISEILIDNEDVYDQARDFMSRVMPNNLNRVKLYQNDVPLFTRYQIESQIESAFAHSVQLPSGGALVIDHTEALVSIDINSARATKGSDIEETALSTNLEAADEIARQLRIRDVGGLIVIDFIDMAPAKNQREVENRLREALKHDRARIQIGRISRFGLLEMSRQRLRPSLGESSLRTCPTCNGRGNVRGPESLALSILRIIEEEAMKENTSKVVAKLPVEIATFLLNEKREVIRAIELRQRIAIVLVPDPLIQSSNYEVHRIRDADTDHEAHRQASYELATNGSDLPDYVREPPRKPVEKPVVRTVGPPAHATAAPAPRALPGGDGKPVRNLLTRLIGSLFGAPEPAGASPPETRQREQEGRDSRNRGRPGGSSTGERRRRSGSRRSGAKRGDNRAAQAERGPQPDRGQQQRPSGRGGRRRSGKRQTRDDKQRTEGGSGAENQHPTPDRQREDERAQNQPRPARSVDRRPAAPSATDAVNGEQGNRGAPGVPTHVEAENPARGMQSGKEAIAGASDGPGPGRDEHVSPAPAAQPFGGSRSPRETPPQPEKRLLPETAGNSDEDREPERQIDVIKQD